MKTSTIDLFVADLDRAIDLFATLGFVVETIVPADDPALVVMRTATLRVRIAKGEGTIPDALLAAAAGSTEAPLSPSFVVTRDEASAWHLGRAGMEYRDLLPDRLGGRFVASHIRIADGGTVPDYVHFHTVRFQIIFCRRGWVRLVYEDQGEPFVMSAGECVVQPPGIRHRVLESSPGLEVIEIGSPAIHATHADPSTGLPTPERRPGRAWNGQRFVRDRQLDGSIAEATGGLVDVRVGGKTNERLHDDDLFFGFVLDGSAALACGGRREALGPGDAFAVPRGAEFEIAEESRDFQWLSVRSK